MTIGSWFLGRRVVRHGSRPRMERSRVHGIVGRKSLPRHGVDADDNRDRRASGETPAADSFLVRGLAATKEAIDSREKMLSVRDAVRAAAGGYLRGHEDFAKRVLKARGMLRYAVGRLERLKKALKYLPASVEGNVVAMGADGLPARIRT
jgi:hypothetical protein